MQGLEDGINQGFEAVNSVWRQSPAFGWVEANDQIKGMLISLSWLSRVVILEHI